MTATLSSHNLLISQQPAPLAAIYCRVSTNTQEDGTSLDTQEAACRRYAAERGYAVTNPLVYREVYTGSELWERPQLAAMREAVRRGEVAAVIAYAVDRLSREQAHLYILDDETERAGADLLFVTEEFEKTAVGKVIRSVKSFAAELEREKIRERTMRGAEAKLRAGKLRGAGKPHYGYRWRDEKHTAYDIDETTAPIVRRIFRMALDGQSIRCIANTLTDEGIPTPTGKGAWSHATVRVILHHRAYIGEVTAHRFGTARVKGKSVKVQRPESEHIALPQGVAPPLIDRDTFSRVQARLERNKAEAPRNNQHPEQFLLRGGFARCGYCGRALTTLVQKKRSKPDYAYPMYLTNNNVDTHRACGQKFTIGAEVLDVAVWERVKAILRNPAIIRREIECRAGTDPTVADREAVEQALVDITRQQTNLTRTLALIDSPEDSAPVIAELTRLGERKRALVAERDALATRYAAWQKSNRSLTNLEAWCRKVGHRLGQADYARKRKALTALGVTILVYRLGHEPRWEFQTALQMGPDGAIVDNPLAGASA